MPSFIVTLGGLLILEGVAIIVLGGSLVGIGNSRFSNEVAIYNIFCGQFDPDGQLDPAGRGGRGRRRRGVVRATPAGAAPAWWRRRPASPR